MSSAANSGPPGARQDSDRSRWVISRDGGNRPNRPRLCV
jgi:hypothetical protein